MRVWAGLVAVMVLTACMFNKSGLSEFAPNGADAAAKQDAAADMVPGTDGTRPLDQAPSPDGPAVDGEVQTPDVNVTPDTFVCPSSICTRCAAGVCIIDASDCSSGCTCPAGMPCKVTCGSSGCQGNVDCSKATDCEIDCDNSDACTGNITCGTGDCDVTCGDDACTGNITCGGSSCSIDCSAEDSCTSNIVCRATSCCIECGKGACGGNVDCGNAKTCQMECHHPSSCAGKTTCPSSCGTWCGSGSSCGSCPP